MIMRNVSEAKAELSALLEMVAKGEEVIIGKAGKPVAKLIAYNGGLKKRVPGQLKGQIWVADDFDETTPELIALFEDRPI